MKKKQRQNQYHSLKFHSPNLQKRVKALVQRINEHARDSTPFDPSIPPHVELTEALHVVAHSGEEGVLKVRYVDGSHGESFPVGSLWPPECPPTPWDPFLQLGTLSFRHLDYDAHVDLYLLRDRETKGLNQGQVERLAAKKMTEVLSSRALDAGGCISLHQSGLEPIVMGVYGALVRFFIARAMREDIPPIYVRPIYYLDEDRHFEASLWGQA